MNTEKDKRLDDLFKKKLEDPVDQIGYREEDWADLEQMLNKHKKRRGIIYWLPVIGSVAALLLLFLGWWIFRPQVPQHGPVNKQQAVNHPESRTGTSRAPNRHPVEPKPAQPNTADLAANSKVKNGSKIGRAQITSSAAASPVKTGLVKASTNDNVSSRADEVLFANSPTPVFRLDQVDTAPVNPVNIQNNNNNAVTAVRQPSKNKIKPQTAFHPQFALSVLAAPDVNGVGSFQQSKVGTNVGLLFSAGVFKKLTVSTGVLYSNKPYSIAFENYHTQYQFPVKPVSVYASCQMLDIPINIGYQVFNKHQNKISVGTGLSSYIMLQEKYKFNYADTYATGPSNYTAPNSSGYFFGVLNLNATYERQVSSKVGISLQPYLKLPLTNLGYSQVRLQTTGVAIGLTWNFNSLPKP